MIPTNAASFDKQNSCTVRTDGGARGNPGPAAAGGVILAADGSVMAQVSATDMRMPIQYALTYPERADAPVPRLDWAQPARWTFDPPDFEKFPLLKLAYQAQETGGSATCTSWQRSTTRRSSTSAEQRTSTPTSS